MPPARRNRWVGRKKICFWRGMYVLKYGLCHTISWYVALTHSAFSLFFMKGNYFVCASSSDVRTQNLNFGRTLKRAVVREILKNMAKVVMIWEVWNVWRMLKVKVETSSKNQKLYRIHQMLSKLLESLKLISEISSIYWTCIE